MRIKRTHKFYFAFFTVLVFFYKLEIDFVKLQEIFKNQNISVFLIIVTLFLLSVFFKIKRTQTLIQIVRPNSLLLNLQGSSLAYLLNLFLPFRLGEIIRSIFIARSLGVSLGFILGTVALDRGLDLLMISLAFFICSASSKFEQIDIFTTTEIGIIFSGTLLAIIVIAFIARARLVLLPIQKLSGYFNETIRNKIRNSIWGLILVFQQTLHNRKLLKNYTFFVIMSWTFTYSAIVLLALTIRGKVQFSASITTFVAFLSSVTLNGNNFLSNYSTKLEDFSSQIWKTQSASEFIKDFSITSWVLFTMPYLLLGLFTLFYIAFKRSGPHFPTRTDNLSNMGSQKLSAPAFYLDSFFTKEAIIENIHKRSIGENFKILEYFKGGSDAVTMLVEESSKKIVKKVTGPIGTNKLKTQELWLKDVNSTGIVKVLNSTTNQNYFEIELEYIDNSLPLFEFIHSNSLESSKKVIVQALDILKRDVYRETSFRECSTDLAEYLNENFYNKLSAVGLASPKFQKLLDTQLPIVINGISYFNLKIIIKKIFASDKCTQALKSMTYASKCHGDFTVDNILIRNVSNEPILIDPSDDNLLKGPLFDFSRLMQSLLGGYEFLNLDENDVAMSWANEAVYINYLDTKSSSYMRLSEWLFDEILEQSLSQMEIKAIKFHVGVLYSRMLTHRLLINEDSMFKYAAVSIKMLNEFYQEMNNGN